MRILEEARQRVVLSHEPWAPWIVSCAALELPLLPLPFSRHSIFQSGQGSYSGRWASASRLRACQSGRQQPGPSVPM